MSTTQMYKDLREQILGFIPISGNPVSGSLGSRLYAITAPDNALLANQPIGTIRIQNMQTNVDNSNTDRQEFDLEVFLYAKPKSQHYVLESIADKIDESFLRFAAVSGSTGFYFCRATRQRDTLTGVADPADREVVTVRLSYHFTHWPENLAAYSGSF